MTEPQEPEGKKANPLFASIVDAAFSDVDGSGDNDGPRLTAEGVAANGVKRWGKFARKRGLPYRKELSGAEIAADPGLLSFFEGIRKLGLPVHGAAGFLEAEWQGVPFTSFAAYAVTEHELLVPYRFVCTPLSRVYPDLLFDFRLNIYQDHRYLYPGYDGYKKVDGPKPPARLKEPGLLDRVPVIREARQIIGGLRTPTTSLHTASEAFGAEVASRQYEPLVFKRDWMVRGRWLVMYEEEHIRALGAPDETPGFLDALPHIRHLVDPSGAPDPEER